MSSSSRARTIAEEEYREAANAVRVAADKISLCHNHTSDSDEECIGYPPNDDSIDYQSIEQTSNVCAPESKVQEETTHASGRMKRKAPSARVVEPVRSDHEMGWVADESLPHTTEIVHANKLNRDTMNVISQFMDVAELDSAMKVNHAWRNDLALVRPLGRELIVRDQEAYDDIMNIKGNDISLRKHVKKLSIDGGVTTSHKQMAALAIIFENVECLSITCNIKDARPHYGADRRFPPKLRSLALRFDGYHQSTEELKNAYDWFDSIRHSTTIDNVDIGLRDFSDWNYDEMCLIGGLAGNTSLTQLSVDYLAEGDHLRPPHLLYLILKDICKIVNLNRFTASKNVSDNGIFNILENSNDAYADMKLRVLDASGMCFDSEFDSVSALTHLEYLNCAIVSGTRTLPASLTSLCIDDLETASSLELCVNLISLKIDACSFVHANDYVELLTPMTKLENLTLGSGCLSFDDFDFIADSGLCDHIVTLAFVWRKNPRDFPYFKSRDLMMPKLKTLTITLNRRCDRSVEAHINAIIDQLREIRSPMLVPQCPLLEKTIVYRYV